MVSPQKRDIMIPKCAWLLALVALKMHFLIQLMKIHVSSIHQRTSNTFDNELLGLLHRRTKQCHAWFLIGFCCLENVRLTWDIFGPVDEMDQLPLGQFDQRVQEVDLCGWLPMVVVALQHGQSRLVQGLEDSHCLRLPGRLQIEAKVKRLKIKKNKLQRKLDTRYNCAINSLGQNVDCKVNQR